MKAKSKAKLISFDIAVHLACPEAIAEYLTQVFADGDADEWLRALGHIAKARGIAQMPPPPGWGARICTRRWRRAPSRGTTR
jgi:probable addiction module antidote protein